MEGRRFGDRVVLYETEPLKTKDGNIKERAWVCQCKCGRVHIVRDSYLRDGRADRCKACKKHGNRPPKETIGMVIDKVKVERFIGTSPGRGHVYEVKCACGVVMVVKAEWLRTQRIKQCPDCAKGILGNVFGSLTAISKAHVDPIRRLQMYVCLCTCGNIENVPSYDLKYGITKQCKICKKAIREEKKKQEIRSKYQK